MADFINPDWAAPSHIKALSTTRAGGVSQAPYDSFNLAQHVDDNPAAVFENRAILKKRLNLPSEPVWLEQVHGTVVLDISKTIINTAQPIADGAYSSQNNTVLAILTADCLPLLLTNQQGDEIAAVHAGWKGLANGIIEQALSLMQAPRQEVIAWAGPCIGPQRFEIGPEVKQQLGGPESAYQASGNQDKLFADLYQLTAARLADAGVNNYSYPNLCTFKDPRFYSYRRSCQESGSQPERAQQLQKGACGRMASLIWIDK